MKKKNIILLTIFSASLFFTFSSKGFAEEVSSLNPQVEARITAEANPDFVEFAIKKTINTEKKINTLSNLKDFSSDEMKAQSYTTTSEVEYYIKTTPNQRSAVGNIGENDIARASITLSYSIIGNTIRVENCSGRWYSKSSTAILVDNRYVTYKGPNVQQTGYKYPSTNSFSYNTGWGYAAQNTAGNGRATMSGYTSYSSMGRIFIQVTTKI